MKIVFRADASFQIGTGHIMRCLTLAEALKKQGAEIEFICRAHKGNLIEHIKQKGFKTYVLPLSQNAVIDDGLYGSQWLGGSQQEDAALCLPILEKIKPDWLIVDHYSLDKTWECLLSSYFTRLLAIDDLANKKHQCDLLLDQTYGRKESDYTGLVPESAQLLLGSEYALLRPEFAEWREYSLQRRTNPSFKTLLITMGGVDPDNVTGELLEVLKNCSLPKELDINIVMGATAPHLKKVQQQAELLSYKINVLVDVSNMAELMANADLAIGAAGATTWERCCLGLPTIQVVTAKNQVKIFEELDSINAIKSLGCISDFPTELEGSIFKSNKLSLVSSSLTEGRGAYRVVEYLSSLNSEEALLKLKPASEVDCDFIYGLQTKQNRKYFRNQMKPSLDQHIDWYDKILKSQYSQVFILIMGEAEVGMLRVDDLNERIVEVSIIISSAFSGRGFAKKALGLLEEILLLKTLKAVIHRENIASAKVFKSLGYELNNKLGLFEEYLKND